MGAQDIIFVGVVVPERSFIIEVEGPMRSNVDVYQEKLPMLGLTIELMRDDVIEIGSMLHGGYVDYDLVAVDDPTMPNIKIFVSDSINTLTEKIYDFKPGALDEKDHDITAGEAYMRIG